MGDLVARLLVALVWLQVLDQVVLVQSVEHLVSFAVWSSRVVSRLVVGVGAVLD